MIDSHKAVQWFKVFPFLCVCVYVCVAAWLSQDKLMSQSVCVQHVDQTLLHTDPNPERTHIWVCVRQQIADDTWIPAGWAAADPLYVTDYQHGHTHAHTHSFKNMSALQSNKNLPVATETGFTSVWGTTEPEVLLCVCVCVCVWQTLWTWSVISFLTASNISDQWHKSRGLLVLMELSRRQQNRSSRLRDVSETRRIHQLRVCSLKGRSVFHMSSFIHKDLQLTVSRTQRESDHQSNMVTSQSVENTNIMSPRPVHYVLIKPAQLGEPGHTWLQCFCCCSQSLHSSVFSASRPACFKHTRLKPAQ